MNVQLYMPNGQTLQEYVDQQIEERLTKALTEGLRIEVDYDTYEYKHKTVKVYYKDTLITWDDFYTSS